MRWTTKSHLHLDRTASAWLLRAMVDPEAEFVFLDWDREPDRSDPRSFGMPGLVLGSHDEGGTCFAKILTAFELNGDAALVALERAIAAGVRRALGIAPPADQTLEEAGLGAALDTIGSGLGLLYADDLEHLAAATPMYDALYQALRATEIDMAGAPSGRPAQFEFLRRQLGLTSPTRQ